jgi:hypothetical protein
LLSGVEPESIFHEANMQIALPLPLWIALIFLPPKPELPDRFFDAPQGPIACRPIAVTPADSAAALLEFIDGESRPRETLAAYDSAGTPLYMTVHVTEPPSTNSVSHSVAVRFSAGGYYLRVERPVRSGSVIAEAAHITDQVELSAAEFAKSKELAIWLWDHRCTK